MSYPASSAGVFSLMGALSVRVGGDHRSKKIAPIGMPKAGHWFVADSPLEGAVCCELVSEMQPRSQVFGIPTENGPFPQAASLSKRLLSHIFLNGPCAASG